MGFGGISVWSLLLILVIVLLLFGTKKLRNIGSDLGGAIKGFKGAMNDGAKEARKDEGAEGDSSERLEEHQEKPEDRSTASTGERDDTRKSG